MRRDLSSWLGTLSITSRKATYRRSRTLKSRGAAHAISLAGGESLDSRKMLAVTTNFNAITGDLGIQLTADGDIAGLLLDTATGKYEVYDDVTKVDTVDATTVKTISVTDGKGGLGVNQTFEVRNGGAIAASLSVTQQVEKTRIADDIQVTSTSAFSGFGIAINSPTIEFSDVTLGDPLFISTNKLGIGLGKTGGNGIIVYGGTDVDISTGAGAGDIEFLDDVLGGEDSGTLTLAAGTGVITFAGGIGDTGEDSALLGVVVNSAKSVTVTGKTYLDGTSVNSFTDGFTIADGVNNVNLSNGGVIGGFLNDGAGIWFEGESTNSTVSGFLLTNNAYGIYLGGGIEGEADLSGTVIDGNQIGEDDIGIYLDNVAGNLNGEDALVIGGTVGNLIAINGTDGIYGWSSTGVEIRNNLIVGNGIDGLGAGSGISLEGGGEYLITENTIGEDGVVGPFGTLGNTFDGITIDGEDGLYSYAGTEIVANTIQFNASHGVRVQGVTVDDGEDSVLIFQNTIVANGLTLLQKNRLPPELRGGVMIDGSENIRIIDNLIGENGLGEDAGNGINIVNGSHGTLVSSNTIVANGNNGIYVENSSTLANSVLVGGVAQLVGISGSTVTLAGDARGSILPDQAIFLASQSTFGDISTTSVLEYTVASLAYDPVSDETTITLTAAVSGSPDYLSAGNYIIGNGADSLGGSGISVLATGVTGEDVVAGLEISGNVIVGNSIDGIHLESTRAASFGDLSDVLIDGNFIGYDIVGEDAPIDFGNGDDGIEVVNGNGIVITRNYVADNGDPNPSIGDDENGIEILGSLNVDVGEDGLGNYIVRNADDGVDIQGSQFVAVVANEIAFNGDDGICIADGSADILVEGNWIHDNVARGVDVSDAFRVTITDNLIENNVSDGVYFGDSRDALVSFNIIRENGVDGVSFYLTNGVIEGNEIYANDVDGVYIEGEDGGAPIYQFEVLGNIIRENGDDGVDVTNGYFYGEDRDGDSGLSRIAGNTIELNDSNGVQLYDASAVLVGGEFPSDINFINLNGNAGVYAYGAVNSKVVGNEIDSNGNYGVEIDNGEDLLVGDTTAEAMNTIRRNGIAGVYVYGDAYNTAVFNNAISENPVGVMITSAVGLLVGSRNFEGEQYGNHIFDNGEGIRATGDSFGTFVQGNLIEDNLTGATLASVRGLTFGYGDDGASESGNVVQNNNEGLRGSGDLTDTSVVGNQFLDNTKVGVALQSAKNLTVGCACGEDTNFISGSPVGLSASGTMTGTEVVFNEFSQNTIGIALSKATGMLVGGNTIDQSLKYGISVTGNNAGTEIFDNTVTNTGDGPYLGSGIYLNGARNVDIIGNDVDGSSLAGLYATGNTSGTVVQGNLFTDNRIGMFLEGATNAVFGGLGEDEGNTIIGGGDELSGEFRDGILVVGTSTGSSIAGTDISDASTGVWFRDAQGIDVNNTYVTGSKFFGFNASGDLTGSKFHDNVVTNTVGIGGGLGHGLHLEGAQNLQVYDNLGEDSFGSGLFVTGDTTGTSVTSNVFVSNRVGISLINATSAVIGGAEGDGNTVLGLSDAANAVYRDGIQVIGTSTGSTISHNAIFGTTTGITLENATGISLEDNVVLGSQFLGVNASGTLTGTSLTGTKIGSTGGLGALGHGIYLANASNLQITANKVFDSTGGGLYATGVTTGTTVYNNDFVGNRVGIYLVNATNAVIGAIGAGEDNRIVGGGDASKGDFRDGILATGTLTGSSITAAEIIGAATGITLSSANGLMITSATVRESQVFGLTASGECVSGVVSSTFTLTAGGAGGGAGVLLSAARSFLIQDATISNNVVGLLATGDCTASAVRGTTWSGNTTGVIDTSTGVPPLVIDPLP